MWRGDRRHRSLPVFHTSDRVASATAASSSRRRPKGGWRRLFASSLPFRAGVSLGEYPHGNNHMHKAHSSRMTQRESRPGYLTRDDGTARRPGGPLAGGAGGQADAAFGTGKHEGKSRRISMDQRHATTSVSRALLEADSGGRTDDDDTWSERWLRRSGLSRRLKLYVYAWTAGNRIFTFTVS